MEKHVHSTVNHKLILGNTTRLLGSLTPGGAKTLHLGPIAWSSRSLLEPPRAWWSTRVPNLPTSRGYHGQHMQMARPSGTLWSLRWNSMANHGSLTWPKRMDIPAVPARIVVITQRGSLSLPLSCPCALTRHTQTNLRKNVMCVHLCVWVDTEVTAGTFLSPGGREGVLYSPKKRVSDKLRLSWVPGCRCFTRSSYRLLHEAQLSFPTF